MRLFVFLLLVSAAASVRVLGDASSGGGATVDENFSEDDDMVQLDAASGRRMYEGYKLLRARPTSQKDLDNINFIKHAVVDFWTPLPKQISTSTSNDADEDVFIPHVDMLVNPLHIEQVSAFFNCSGLDYDVAIDNLQSAIETENVAAEEAEAGQEEVLLGRPGFCTDLAKLSFHQYSRYSAMEDYLKCLANRHTSKVQLHYIGSTYENRSMHVIKIGTNDANPSVWIDGGIHAREWISPASVLYMINQLVENYGLRENRDLVDRYNFYIIPSVNPDGYEHSHLKDRLWRKTRSVHRDQFGRTCYGTDPNRNWGYEWGGLGASENACSDTFRGPRAFSESETENVRNFITNKIPRNSLRLYLTFHSYGQFILYPWGFSDTHPLPDNVKSLERMGHNAAEAMRRVNGNSYKVGSAARLLYPAAGGSDDWAKGSMRVPYSFTVELPDTGRYGFLLPADRIERTAREAFEGVKSMVREL